jgi:class 3 adenylate cyclase/DNA-binding SARP family transcriptional activator
MEFRILGPLEAVDGDATVALGGVKQRTLLAILLLNANEVVSADRLIDELWGERSPESGRSALQVRVSQLRKTLGDGGSQLLTRAPGYVLSLEREQLDLQRFERLVRQAAADEPPAAARKLREALALWRGPPLADLAYEAFAQAAIGRLQELRIGAIEKRIDADLALGRHDELVVELEELVAEHPTRERLRAQLMLALYRCGRQADALEVYRRTRAELSAELGLEPGPELNELQSAILNQDPALAKPSPQTDVVPGSPPPDRGPGMQPDAPRRARKVVTVLFCDVTGSTALGEEHDPEALFGVMNRYFEELRTIIERHGGTVAKFIGDAVMAVFGIPRVHEEDALRAVRAAAEIRARLPGIARAVGVELRFRTGINTGLVLVGEGENLAVGDAVNVAARLEQAAQPGEILLGEVTYRLVRDAVEVVALEALSLKGKSEPVTAFRLLAVDPLAPGLARRFDVALVGRERELRALRDAWDRAVAEAGCHLFTLLGAAGVGKSRLVAELLSAVVEEARLLQGRCLPYGEGITFWPLLEALTGAGEETEAVLERLRSGGTATPHELFLEVRLTLESLAADGPVLVHIDDLQWAEPLLLDLLDHIVELSRGAPILLLCTARAELLEERPVWGGGKLNATTMMLEPLGNAECEALLFELGDGVDPPARERVVTASGGNPLFLEEMSALVRETGSHAVPSTIQALLAARLERLDAEEREVLERGAVEGEVFHRGVARLLAGGERSELDVDAWLAGLVRKDLIRPHAATLPGDEAFRFRHLLIRDAAYDGLPKATRAELHERLARALDAAPDLTALDEIAGWHLEQAVRYRRELDENVSGELSEAASEHLHAAGLRARERDDVMAAKNLLERARLLAPEGDIRRARIGLDLAEQLIKAGEVAQVDELLTDARRHPDVDALTALTRLEWMTHVRPPGATQAIESQLPGLLERFARIGDERALARSHMLAHGLHWMRARATPAGEELRLAGEHARIAKDDGLRQRALAAYVDALRYCSLDARTISDQLDAIERERPGPYLAASVDIGRSTVAGLEGRVDDARRLMQRAADRFRSLGNPKTVGSTGQTHGALELWLGDPAAALEELQRSDAILARLGERSMRSTTQAFLAQAHWRLGNADAARAAIELAEALGGTDDVATMIETHPVRAQMALADGDGEAAERWARSAVDHAFSTDALVDQAKTKLELARIVAALDRPDEAISEAQAALELFEAKGDRPGGEQARAVLAEVEAGPTTQRPARARARRARPG